MSSPLLLNSLTIGAIALLAMIAADARAELTSPPVSPTVELDHSMVLAGTGDAVFVLVSFDIPEAEHAGANRPDLNLGLVIDRSGSMEDAGKLAYAKQAATKLVQGLKSTDHIGVVEYDDKITVLWPASRLRDSKLLMRRIEQLTSRGGTNLTGGMLAGAAEVQKNKAATGVHRVLLLSDGMANEGVTDPREIQRLVRAVKAKGIQITTMGLGTDYNEDLMQAIAENGGGRYYFIEHPSQVARIFQEEMNIMAKSVAKNVRLKFDRGPMATSAEVYGYPAEQTGRRVTVVQEDFYAGESRSLLLRVELDPKQAGRHLAGTILLEYEDAEDGRPRAIEREVFVTATADPALVEASRNERVMAESSLIEAEKRQADSLRKYEAGDRAGAERGLAELATELETKNVRLKDTRLKKKLDSLRMSTGEMNAADASAHQKSLYLKKAKKRMYSGGRGTTKSYVLEEGTRGYEVERLQEALKKVGVYLGPIDGEFDIEVTVAVRTYQTNEGLEVDGVAGPFTLQKLGIY